MKTLVVIPTLNSYEYILDTIVSIEANAPEVDYVVIDIGSDERTKAYLSNNDIPRLTFPFEVDYYKAISLGMTYAYENGYDAMVEFDDKGRHKSEDIFYLVQTHENTKANMVFASRYLEKNSKAKKAFGTRWLRMTSWIACRKKISDPKNRFKLYDKNVIDFFSNKKDYNDPSPDRIIQLLRSGFTFKEVNSKLVWGNGQSIHKGIWSFLTILGWGLSMIFVQPFRRKAEK